jgi:hypothetical protein
MRTEQYSYQQQFSQIGLLFALSLVVAVASELGPGRATATIGTSPPTRLRAGAGGPRYNIGTPTLQDVWVDPVSGNDDTTNGQRGTTRTSAFQTLLAAWRSLPTGTLSGTGYRIRLLPGTYRGAYLEGPRYGSTQFPILIEPADGPGTVSFVNTPADRSGQISILDSRYVYLQDFTIRTDTTTPEEAGDVFQCERCDHLLLRRMTFSGLRRNAQTENIKINQSQYVYIEDSSVSGAGDNALDMVAVQYGHVVGTQFADAIDWCVYVKGGSAYLQIESNLFTRCGTGGFTAGQGTGFQFMIAPWLQYEAYDIKVVNNIIHDVEGAGLGVNGGYNILLAYNTIYRSGSRDHAIEVLPGRRGCDGNRADLCQPLLNQGGWGTLGQEEQFIPNKNVFIYNNLIYNPSDAAPITQIIDVRGPVTPPTGSGAPDPARSDDNLVVRGNVIWVQPSNVLLGVEDPAQGCQPGNATCTATQLQADNTINGSEPELADPARGDLRPRTGGNLLSSTTLSIPAFAGGDLPNGSIPVGTLTNSVPTDYNGSVRNAGTPPGAYATAANRPVAIVYLPVVTH